MSEERRIENIPIQKIIPNIYQPRIKFDKKSITELSNSIKKYGIIHPLILRQVDDCYEIIDGERRYKAAKKIGLEKLPAVILNIDDKDVAELILIENMQKRLLTPIEEANAYQQIMLLNRLDIKQLAKKLEKSEETIENKLKLLTLPTQIQEALLNNKIAEGHARALTKVSNKKKKIELFNRVLNERITVKNLEELIKKEENKKEKEELKENDSISLNDLNKKDFFEIKKNNKMEEKKMDNTQMNFNQYNNLLKEKDIPQIGAISQPEPILGAMAQEPKNNDFFPSLEEQPLNFDIPVFEPQNNNEVPTNIPVSENMVEQPIEMPAINETPIQMPQFEMPTQNMGMPVPMMGQTMAAPVMNEAPMQMPQFEMPMQNMGMSEPMMGQAMAAPVMNEVPMQMPQFEIPMQNMGTPAPMMGQAMAAPVMNEVSMQMPQFEMPMQNMGMSEPVISQPMTSPVMNEVPMQMPQFEIPVQNVIMPEPVIEQPMETSIENNQPKVMTNVMPAVNMIRNLVPLLENSGYRIIIEEVDNLNEYQVVLKVEK